jgi:hypothetical protein
MPKVASSGRACSAPFPLLVGAPGEVPPEEDDGDEKDYDDDILDAVGLEEVHITVEITHLGTSFGACLCMDTDRSIAVINISVK